MSKDTSCGHGRDVALIQKQQIIGQHKANKLTKEIAKVLKLGEELSNRTLQSSTG